MELLDPLGHRGEGRWCGARDESAAATAATAFDDAEPLEALKGGPNTRSRDLEVGGQRALPRQQRALGQGADRDAGEDVVGDLLRGAREADDLAQPGELLAGQVRPLAHRTSTFALPVLCLLRV